MCLGLYRVGTSAAALFEWIHPLSGAEWGSASVAAACRNPMPPPHVCCDQQQGLSHPYLWPGAVTAHGDKCSDSCNGAIRMTAHDPSSAKEDKMVPHSLAACCSAYITAYMTLRASHHVAQAEPIFRPGPSLSTGKISPTNPPDSLYKLTSHSHDPTLLIGAPTIGPMPSAP